MTANRSPAVMPQRHAGAPEALGYLPGEPETRWQTVADVVADFEAMAGVVA